MAKGCCGGKVTRGKCIKCGHAMRPFDPKDQPHDWRGWCINPKCEMFKDIPGNEGGQLWLNDFQPPQMPPMPSASSLPKVKFG